MLSMRLNFTSFGGANLRGFIGEGGGFQGAGGVGVARQLVRHYVADDAKLS
jgi:hypothetical protein